MSRQHANNWSHTGHYLVHPYTCPWSPNGHGYGHELLSTLCNVNRPSHSEIQLFQYLAMKIHGQGHVCRQRSRSHLTFKIQRSRSWSRWNPLVKIWGLEFNRCVWFSFRSNWTSFGGDIANSIYDLENSRSKSWPRSNLMVTFEALSSINMFAFRFVAIGPFLAEI